jgi:hypothetical protein
MPPPDLHVVTVEQTDPRLGRQCVHDPRSRNFAAPRVEVRRKNVAHRIYDRRPNPNQTHGNCTGCAEAMLGNARGNRQRGVMLDMDAADRVYSLATQLDPWDGQWPPTDTGSSGTAAAKAAVQLGIGERYQWYFGIDAVLDGLQQRPLSVGTWWTFDMFHPDPRTKLVRPTGGRAGGHQWIARAYDASASKLTIGQQRVGGACWWGDYHFFWITVDDFADLLADDGDVHHTYRANPNA